MKFLLYFASLYTLSLSASANIREGRIFKIGQTQNSPDYIQETKIISTNDQMIWSSQIKDSKGDLIMTERAVIEGSRVTEQEVVQLQIGERYELKVDQGKATFSTFKMDPNGNKTLEASNTIKISDQFTMGPAVEFFLNSKWQELSSGEKVLVEFGIFELQKTVRFEFKKISETDSSLVVQMKPANFFLGFLVDPIRIEFDKKSKMMTRYIGRTPLRQMIKGKWEALDSEITYSLKK